MSQPPAQPVQMAQPVLPPAQPVQMAQPVLPPAQAQKQAPSQKKPGNYTHMAIVGNDVQNEKKDFTKNLDDECHLQLTAKMFDDLKNKLTAHLNEAKGKTIDKEITEVEAIITDFKNKFDTSIQNINKYISVTTTHLGEQKTGNLRNVNSNPQALDNLVKPIERNLKNINGELKVFSTSRFFTRQGMLDPEKIANDFRKKIKKSNEDIKSVLLENITGDVVIKSLLPGKKDDRVPCTVISVNTETKMFRVTFLKNNKREPKDIQMKKVCLVD